MLPQNALVQKNDLIKNELQKNMRLLEIVVEVADDVEKAADAEEDDVQDLDPGQILDDHL